jgi:hypothetical protein
MPLLTETPSATDLRQHPGFLALRCLALTRDLVEFAKHFPVGWRVDDDFSHEEWKEADNTWKEDGEAHMHLSRMPQGFEIPARAPRGYPDRFLLQMLISSIEGAHVLLLQEEPSAWPWVFDTICILLLVQSQLESCESFTSAFKDAENKLFGAIIALSDFFLSYVGDLHPLNDEPMDGDWFRMLVGDMSHHGDWAREIIDGYIDSGLDYRVASRFTPLSAFSI